MTTDKVWCQMGVQFFETLDSRFRGNNNQLIIQRLPVTIP